MAKKEEKVISKSFSLISNFPRDTYDGAGQIKIIFKGGNDYFKVGFI